MYLFILGICFLFFSIILYSVKLLSLSIYSINYTLVSMDRILTPISFKDYFYSEFKEIDFFVFIFFVIGIVFLIKAFKQKYIL